MFFLKFVNITKLSVELYMPRHTSPDPPLFDLAYQYVFSYLKAEVGKVTCFIPIKSFCGNVFSIQTENIRFLYELLPTLYEKSLIKKYFRYNMETLLKEDTFYIRKYGFPDIDFQIRRAIKGRESSSV